MFESITDSNSVENKFEFELIALYSFEGAGNSTFKRAKGRRPGSPWGCSSAGRAPALQAGGHRFEPVHLHQLFKLGKEAQLTS